MNTVDIVIGCALGFGLIRGYLKGFFVEITSLVGLVLGVYGAIHFSYFLADFLKAQVHWDTNVVQIVAFVGTFLIILIALALLGKVLTKIAKTLALGVFNKILGAIFGLLKYGLIFSVLLTLFSHFNHTMKFVSNKKLEQSSFYEPVKNLAPSLFPNLIKVVEKSNEK